MDIIGKFIPEKIQKLLEDHEIKNNLSIVMEELDKEMITASKNPAVKGKLKDAFNDAAMVLTAASTYLKKGKLSVWQAANLARKRKSLKESFNTFQCSYESGDHVVVGCRESLKGNAKMQTAVRNILLKTKDDVFRLEDGPDGQGYAIELVTGNNFSIPISKEDYAEIKALMKDGGTGDDAKKCPPPPKNTP